ncbi:MAG: hypothetical protein ACRD28_01535 [Acidobacteriaceae bacterium]
MVEDNATATAIAQGQQMAEEILQRRAIVRAQRASVLANHPRRLDMNVQIANVAGAVANTTSQTAGFLLAIGDSWFDYPATLIFCDDVLQHLEHDHGYNVESTAHHGDPAETMAYSVAGQLYRLSGCLDKILAQGATPKAALLSGGGDDMAGKEFGMLLNSALSPVAGWNTDIVQGLIEQRIAIAYTRILTGITVMCKQRMGTTGSIPILVHGYDYPVPDGRGYLGGWPFPGPWLQPGFREKLFSDLPRNVALMHDIIDKFNEMLAGLTKTFANVHYVDVRGTLSADLTDDAYQSWWSNELHPTDKGFGLVADKFATALAALP